MQKQGKPQFMHHHNGVVQGVAFNPKDRYIFCSGATDGKINIYSALHGGPIMSARLTSPSSTKNINAVRFTADGSRIITTTAKRLTVIDAERGMSVGQYDNCAYSGRERAPLATDPTNTNLAICACTSGKGVIQFDFRKKQPIRFALNVHSSIMRDLIFIDKSWPYGGYREQTVASVSLDGVCKVRTFDDRLLLEFDVGSMANCLTATPDLYSDAREEGFASMIMVGGDNIYGHIPGNLDEDAKILNYGSYERPIQRMKYTSNGHFLFTASSEGQVCRYRRIGNDYHFMNELYTHNKQIVDMDISPTDEYLVTASRGGDVGLLCLGVPSHGWTGFMQLA